MNEKKNRTAYLASNETTKASGVRTNIQVDITIDRVIPIVAFNDNLVTKQAVTSYPHPPLVDAEVLNTLSEDLDGNERYTYIGYAVSAITSSGVRMYYDAKHSDVIVIPDTELLIVDVDMQSGKVYRLSGYALGSTIRSNHSNTFNSLSSDITDDDSNELPLFNKNISSIKSHILTAHGIGYNNNVSKNMLGIMVTPEVYLERSGTDKTMLIELGTASDVLTAVIDKLPVYTMLQHSPSIHTAIYCGMKTVPIGVKIGYVLDF